MKNLKEKNWAKILAFILFNIFLAVLIASVALFVRMGYDGVYSHSSAEAVAERNLQRSLYYVAESIARMTDENSGGEVDRWLGNLNLWYSVSLDGKELANNVSGKYRPTTYKYYPQVEQIKNKSTGEYLIEEETGEIVRTEYEVTLYVKRDLDPNLIDDVARAYSDADLAFRYRWLVVGAGITSFILSIFCVCFLIVSAGHKKGKDGISLNAFDRIPLDLLGLALIIFGYFSAAFIFSYFAPMGFVIVPATYLLLTFTLMSFAARVKAGHWWKNTLIYRFCRFAKANLGPAVFKIPLVWRTGTVLLVYALFQICLANMAYHSFPAFMLLTGMTVGLCIMILLCTVWVVKLHKGAAKIAGGALESKIDTSQMLWDYKRYGDTLNRIGGGLERAVDESTRSERMKTELITNVSHDIKTPLTSIVNYVDLLSKEETDNEKIKEYTGVLVRQSDKLRRLVTDLVDASKISSGNVEVELIPTDLTVVVAQVDGEYRDRLEEKGLNLVVQTPEIPVMVQADGRHLWRILDNLMSNVLKYALEGSRVYLSLERREDKACIVLKNMSKYQLNIGADELMDRFVRGDDARSTEGNGLGLSIAGSLAEALGGRLGLIIDGDLFKAEVCFRLT